MAEQVRRALAEGRLSVPATGAVLTDGATPLPFRVVDGDGQEIPAVGAYLRHLGRGNVSPLTCRSYAFGLLRWYRLLWCLSVEWDQATATEAATLVEWMRASRNPRGSRHFAPPAPSFTPSAEPNGPTPPPRKGTTTASVERETVMPAPRKGAASVDRGPLMHAPHRGTASVERETLMPAPKGASSAEREMVSPPTRQGYAGKTIDHALTVVQGFYSFHGRQGNGPRTNPIQAYRRALKPGTPVERPGSHRKTASRAPQTIPAMRWQEMVAGMGCDRDRALLEFYVSTGARVSELLRLALEDIDWTSGVVYLAALRTRLRRPVRASADAFRHLGRYLAADGFPAPGQPLWRTRRGEIRPMTYWAAQQVLQRANDQLGAEWTWQDARHTAIVRMTHDEPLTPAEVRAHATARPT
ncbi:tyrosine-type recombinase/integrase [Sphaerisporangium rhizosphaerae]|uniref:Tyrosine-type recombinase/integrase n=1 Tax=Sphaerisporangium rhizosphaerae TaxID=2269375 RepID=A0ABW2PFC8_9ACTN